MKKLSEITESIWSDMQDRSAGDVVRKEDDINLLDETGLVNYMKKVYMPPSPNDDLQIIGGEVNSGTIIASLFKTNEGHYNIIYQKMSESNPEITFPVCPDSGIEDLLKEHYTVISIPRYNNKIYYIKPKDGSKITNKFFLEIIDFILDAIKDDDNIYQVIFKKKHINESIWSDMQDRSAGDVVRKEDEGKHITIDGIKWVLSKDFWDLGDEYNDENSDEWRCFAFNKPKDGTNIVKGNGEDTGVFGYDRWDIGEDEYDVYVIDDFINYTTADKFINHIVKDCHSFDDVEKEIYDILVKYLRKVFDDKHMSEFAYYIIYEQWGSDRDGGCETPISAYVDLHSTELPVEEVDFEYNKEDIESIHYLDYVMLDNWYEDLRSELISTYQELGYIWLKDYELDPFNSPGNTEGLCFVKIKNVRYEETE